MANLRLIYANKLTQVNGASTAASLNDYKSQTQNGTTFTLTTSSITGPVAVVAMLANTTGTVTMTVTGQTGVVEATTSNVNTSPNVGYGGTKYIAKYFTLASGTTSFTVTFSQAVDVSRFIVGNYWIPKYNIPFGISVGFDDATTIERLQSGDQYTTVMPRSKTMSFELAYLDESDKFYLFDLVRTIGKTSPVFVSAFPEDSYQDKEQMYSIYGRFNTPPNIAHNVYTMYASSIQLDEI